MRKALLTIALVIVCLLGYTQKGSVLVYGDFNYHRTESNSQFRSKDISWGVNPGIGYQFTNKWTLGLAMGYYRTNQSYVSNQYRIGPFARYSRQLSDLLAVFGQIEASYLADTYSEEGNTISRYKIYSIKAFPAIELNLGKGFAMNFNLGGIQYQSYNSDQNSDKHNSLSITFGSGAWFGISKRFGGENNNSNL